MLLLLLHTITGRIMSASGSWDSHWGELTASTVFSCCNFVYLFQFADHHLSIHYLHRGVNIIVAVCACLCVFKLSPKVINGFWWNFVDRVGCSLGRNWLDLVAIQILSQILNHFPGFFTIGKRAKTDILHRISASCEWTLMKFFGGVKSDPRTISRIRKWQHSGEVMLSTKYSLAVSSIHHLIITAVTSEWLADTLHLSTILTEAPSLFSTHIFICSSIYSIFISMFLL